MRLREKHFTLICAALREARQLAATKGTDAVVGVDVAAVTLAEHLKPTNPKFDAGKFFAQVEIGQYPLPLEGGGRTNT